MRERETEKPIKSERERVYEKTVRGLAMTTFGAGKAVTVCLPVCLYD